MCVCCKGSRSREGHAFGESWWQGLLLSLRDIWVLPQPQSLWRLQVDLKVLLLGLRVCLHSQHKASLSLRPQPSSASWSFHHSHALQGSVEGWAGVCWGVRDPAGERSQEKKGQKGWWGCTHSGTAALQCLLSLYPRCCRRCVPGVLTPDS